MLSRRSQQQPENIGATQRMTLSILEPTRGLLLQKRSKDMRSENAITPSRREFLSDALGIGHVLATPHIGYVSDGLYNTFYEDTVSNIRQWLNTH